MNITIIGGGNIGTLMAAEFANKGHKVIMYTSKPSLWNEEISVYNCDEELILRGKLALVINSMQEAIKNADYIWVTMPAEFFLELSVKMFPFVHKGQKIGIVPGSGGAEFAFNSLIQKECILFGLQRVHSIARLKKYGESVYELGRKAEIQIGAISSKETEHICNEVSALFDMPCRALDNYLSVTLTPSNQILHTARLYSMFRDYKLGFFYPRNILFYEEWTNEASQILITCDQELQQLCKVIPLDLSAVKSLKKHYESQTVEQMTKKIRGIKAFKGLTSPMKKNEKGWVPDWNSRYFTTDFSYGLKIIKEIAELFSVTVPNINTIWEWYELVTMKEKVKRIPTELTVDKFISLYQQ